MIINCFEMSTYQSSHVIVWNRLNHCSSHLSKEIRFMMKILTFLSTQIFVYKCSCGVILFQSLILISFIWFGLRANFSAADLESLTDLAFIGRRNKGKSVMIACTSGCWQKRLGIWIRVVQLSRSKLIQSTLMVRYWFMVSCLSCETFCLDPVPITT